MELNLLPADLKPPEIDRLQVVRQAMVVLVIVAVVASYGLFYVKLHQVTRKVAALDKEIARLELEGKRIVELTTEADRLQQQADSLKSLSGGDSLRWSDMLRGIQQVLTDGVWLTDIRHDGGEVELNGVATSVASVGYAVDGLARLPFASRAEVVEMRQEAGGTAFKIRILLR